MKNKLLLSHVKIFLIFVTLLSRSETVNAQSELKVFEEWGTTEGTQNFFYRNVVKTDASGNVYIAGATVNDTGNYDILVAKYNRRGGLEWLQQYDGGFGDDIATALVVDRNGNVYITGL
jgi:hypothetical protein